ncbi:TMhelix containing protein [Vibrio phage 1.110.O._10N.261.52.C1]|nr:TMhelix containing protein [Vibrio phage 1.074.O._10N.222.49.B7]AUR88155.1 TMhelix containing protein [Vibrio phage 1.110.O._10N.261.52.C1]AUR89766.1 TMhelix containing protein [Vibrio phage 1.132.O._10N.222.49.F8]AUR90617.1 TMhelix containing protein [Vibrio phage 1.148.O._10N.286.54.A10]AUR96558.1 TMhelix containing protein [Vibrio phage 1.226.O._10N.261.48.E5]AUR96841.1 TMhelix containing protein [Vibrio phage 1.233.A._10N.261.51.E6]AUR96901.1 TMhelix containing protein [Vibrio phage 1.
MRRNQMDTSNTGSSAGVAGVAATGAAAGNGLTDIVTQNFHLLSLSFTCISCIGGLIFLYLNWKENKRRNDLLEQKEK